MSLYKQMAGMFLAPFPEVIWRISSLQNTVSLTFDDGPHPQTTPAVLEILDHFQLSATFFLTGERIEQYKSQLPGIQYRRQQLGSHGYDHLPLNLKSSAHIESSLLRTDQLIRRHFKQIPVLFRPPYGIFGPALRRAVLRMNKKLVLWSVLSNDFTWEPQRVLDRLQKNVKAGDIICFHDSEKTRQTVVQVLPQFISYCQKEQIHFETLTSPPAGRTVTTIDR